MTSHQKEFTQRFDRYLRQSAEVGQSRVSAGAAWFRSHLAAMKRGYTSLEYKSVIRRLRAVRPDITVSSDFIVGFR